MTAPIDTSVIRDEQRTTIWWGVSSDDGTTLVPIQVDSATGRLAMEIGTSTMPVIAILPETLPREGNRIPCLGGQSSTDASVLIPVSVNPSTGAIQAQTT